MQRVPQGFVAKRFRQILVHLEDIPGLGLKTSCGVQRRHQNDFDPGVRLFQPARQLTPVHFRHERVGEHDVEDHFLGQTQRFCRAADSGDVVTHLLDIAGCERPDWLFVIDDEHVRPSDACDPCCRVFNAASAVGTDGHTEPAGVFAQRIRRLVPEGPFVSERRVAETGSAIRALQRAKVRVAAAPVSRLHVELL